MRKELSDRPSRNEAAETQQIHGRLLARMVAVLLCMMGSSIAIAGLLTLVRG